MIWVSSILHTSMISVLNLSIIWMSFNKTQHTTSMNKSLLFKWQHSQSLNNKVYLLLISSNTKRCLKTEFYTSVTSKISPRCFSMFPKHSFGCNAVPFCSLSMFIEISYFRFSRICSFFKKSFFFITKSNDLIYKDWISWGQVITLVIFWKVIETQLLLYIYKKLCIVF